MPLNYLGTQSAREFFEVLNMTSKSWEAPGSHMDPQSTGELMLGKVSLEEG